MSGIVGKYHVAPRDVYTFDYMKIGNPDQLGRNITYMKGFVKEFLQQANEKDKPFFLYIAFHDPHRAGGNYGPFMNKWGNGQPGHGHIPDWKPIEYDPAKVIVPYFLPDTPATRADIAAMYTSFNRMDQGIGLFLNELQTSGHLEDTLILWTSDNGIPFPNAKTNLYESGMGEPMIISSPEHKEHWGKHTDGLASITDFVPTILDWFQVKYPQYELNGERVSLTGRSLLPLVANPSQTEDYPHVFSSHDMHEVTMAYPMRVIRTDRYRLIHNINNRAPYPLATDLYNNPTFLDILNRTRHGQPTHWFKSLHQYYYREEWELFDLVQDPHELKNLATDQQHKQTFTSLKSVLDDWLLKTNDPWRCMPHGLLLGGQCLPMDNYYSSEQDQLAFRVV
ncbi:N-sulphoglucosamine sulphohydrolase-like [Plakobranchus ocellatus]|uniref:N-sulphoglucosamine sulphohydrolase-like n=1 Tax=Plakobranchus ocellatus TaxID=259542 RepID=A0AAV3YWQ8_9GAST|nr:N-sulphoglucosamine sulphohydrolase-like [Plakobranchus ocellatus]